ncbi:MAG TPA: zinc ABC transporter substrate-binding protein [Burkholderiales bacterium]|nr:zinc ABC transporter substrate-binding protein [Burkholderiales bacterium]
MKTFLSLLSFTALLSWTAPALSAVNVFACEPEWGALASEIGGDRVSIYTATTALQDHHKVQARPSLIAHARVADLVVCSGAELEVGWMPVVIGQSGNNKINVGKPGNLEAANYVPLQEVPTLLDRSLGDVHPRGNPHIQWGPQNIQLVADELAKRLTYIDPPGKAYYESRLASFTQRWAAATKRWEQEAASLKGVAVIEHHKELTYLFDWLGMPVVGALEPKPGVEPTSSHLSALVEQQKSNPAKLIVITTQKNPEAAQWLSGQIKVPEIALPATVGGTPGAKDLFSMYDDAINRLLAAEKPKS